MKKKLFLSLVLLMFLCNAFTFSFAALEDVDVADKEIIIRGIVNRAEEKIEYTEDGELIEQKKDKKDPPNPSLMGDTEVVVVTVKTTETYTDSKGEEHTKSHSKDIKRPSTSIGSIEPVTIAEIEAALSSLPGERDHDAATYASDANSKIASEYSPATIATGATYSVHEDWRETVEGLGGRRLLVPVSSGLRWVNFDERDIDLYQRDLVKPENSTVDDNRSNRYRAGAVYDSHGKNAEHNETISKTRRPDSANYFKKDEGYFLLGVKKATCLECKANPIMDGKPRNVAVPDPVSMPDTTVREMYAASNCEYHTCAFIWRIRVGISAYNFKETDVYEGLRCDKPNTNKTEYCDLHRCNYNQGKCAEPVIGTNMVDARYPYPIPYQGRQENGYSGYCENHFCIHYECIEVRTGTNATIPLLDKDKKVVTGFGEYCSEHGNDCALMSCPNENSEEGEECEVEVIEGSYLLTHKPLCMPAVTSNYQFKYDKYEILSDENDLFMFIDEVEEKRCANCGQYIMEIRSVGDLCYNCAELESPELWVTFNTAKNAEGTVADNEEIKVDNEEEKTGDYEVEEIIDYEENIARLAYTGGVLEKIEEVKNELDEIFEHGIKNCRECKKISIWVELDGAQVCSGCGMDEAGQFHEQIQ